MLNILLDFADVVDFFVNKVDFSSSLTAGDVAIFALLVFLLQSFCLVDGNRYDVARLFEWY